MEYPQLYAKQLVSCAFRVRAFRSSHSHTQRKQQQHQRLNKAKRKRKREKFNWPTEKKIQPTKTKLSKITLTDTKLINYFPQIIQNQNKIKTMQQNVVQIDFHLCTKQVLFLPVGYSATTNHYSYVDSVIKSKYISSL